MVAYRRLEDLDKSFSKGMLVVRSEVPNYVSIRLPVQELKTSGTGWKLSPSYKKAEVNSLSCSEQARRKSGLLQ